MVMAYLFGEQGPVETYLIVNGASVYNIWFIIFVTVRLMGALFWQGQQVLTFIFPMP